MTYNKLTHSLTTLTSYVALAY